MTLTPEILVPRIGDALVEQNLLSPGQLATALQIQAQERENGKTYLIGQVLVDHGFISQDTLNQAVTHQILLLHEALQQSNANLEQRVKDRTRELEIAYQKLDELSKLKANFVSNISHELRTPLTHIKGYINLLVEGELENLHADQKYALGVIEKASERLSRLIEDLILFSTSETSTLQINKESVDLIELTKKVIDQNQSNADEKKVSLRMETNINPAEITTDGIKLTWVLNQLVDNAIKYTSSGGKIFVRIQTVDHKVEICVVDTGLGIPPDRIGEIFEPFHQLDESTTRQQGGTGLGLSLAKKIIEALGSTLVVTSTLGKGSSFKFTL